MTVYKGPTLKCPVPISLKAKASMRVFPKMASYMGAVATRLTVPDQLNPAFKYMRGRRHHSSRTTITNPFLRFPNFYVDGYHAGSTYTEKGSGASATITASIEYPSGTFTQVTFSGVATGTIANLSYLDSDVVPITIPPNTDFIVRYFWTSTIGVIFLQGASLGTNVAASLILGDIMDVSATVLTDNTMGGTYTATTGTSGYGPMLIAAQTNKPSMLLIGDSICYGENDTGDTSGDVGVLARSIGPSYAYANYGIGGDSLTQFNAHSTLRRSIINYFSHVISDYGINDLIINAETAGQIAAATIAHKALFAGIKPCYITTMLPAATTTDNYATTVNQTTAAYNATRVTENNRRRSNVDGWSGVFENADVIESARDSGLIKPALGYFTNASSVHPKQAGYLAVKNAGVINPVIFS